MAELPEPDERLRFRMGSDEQVRVFGWAKMTRDDPSRIGCSGFLSA
jgi:hypothetical protein